MRFMFSGHPVFQKAAQALHQAAPAESHGRHLPPEPYRGSLTYKDAFQTIIEWLYTRMQRPL